MARRRSYLQILAAPMRPEGPLLFPVAQPAPDEARPSTMPRREAATAPVSPIPNPPEVAAPTASSSFSKSPTSRPAAPKQRRNPEFSDAKNSIGSAGEPIQAAEGPPLFASAPHDPILQNPASGVIPGIASAKNANTAATPASPVPPSITATADFWAQPVALPILAAAEGAQTAAAEPAKPAKPSPRPAIRNNRENTVSASLPPELLPPAPASQNALPGPRIHIGTIEIRTAPAPAPILPPAPQPVAMRAAPSAALPNLSRPYAWRFGLNQG